MHLVAEQSEIERTGMSSGVLSCPFNFKGQLCDSYMILNRTTLLSDRSIYPFYHYNQTDLSVSREMAHAWRTEKELFFGRPLGLMEGRSAQNIALHFFGSSPLGLMEGPDTSSFSQGDPFTHTGAVVNRN